MPIDYPGHQDEKDTIFVLQTIERLKKLTPVTMKWRYSGVTGPGPGEPRCQNFHGWPSQNDPNGGRVAVIHLWFEEPTPHPVTGELREQGWGAGIDMPLGSTILLGGEGLKTEEQALTTLLDAVNRTFIQMSMNITQTVEGLLRDLPKVVLSGLLYPIMEGRALTRAQFIEQFVVSFLAAWAQNHYESASLRRETGIYMEGAPVEDARKLAEQAWELMED